MLGATKFLLDSPETQCEHNSSASTQAMTNSGGVVNQMQSVAVVLLSLTSPNFQPSLSGVSGLCSADPARSQARLTSSLRILSSCSFSCFSLRLSSSFIWVMDSLQYISRTFNCCRNCVHFSSRSCFSLSAVSLLSCSSAPGRFSFREERSQRLSLKATAPCPTAPTLSDTKPPWKSRGKCLNSTGDHTSRAGWEHGGKGPDRLADEPPHPALVFSDLAECAFPRRRGNALLQEDIPVGEGTSHPIVHWALPIPAKALCASRRSWSFFLQLSSNSSFICSKSWGPQGQRHIRQVKPEFPSKYLEKKTDSHSLVAPPQYPPLPTNRMFQDPSYLPTPSSLRKNVKFYKHNLGFSFSSKLRYFIWSKVSTDTQVASLTEYWQFQYSKYCSFFLLVASPVTSHPGWYV